jgi:hypothetical protein
MKKYQKIKVFDVPEINIAVFYNFIQKSKDFKTGNESKQ